jgi:hypothetical protein
VTVRPRGVRGCSSAGWARGILLLAAIAAIGSIAAASASAATPKPKHRTGHHPRRVTATRRATAVFSVGAGNTVTIRGGGADTSNCTSNETDTSFVTKGNNESHEFGFESRGGGSCNFERSWSYFKVTVKNAAGKAIGYGDMYYGEAGLFGGYGVWCGREGGWTGLVCTKTGDASLKLTPDLPGKRRNVGLRDHTVFAGATFDIPDGYNIDIVGGGGGTSNCTKDETVASFPSGGTDRRHLYSMVARDEGLCRFEFSWSDFKVKLRDPREGNRVVGNGIMWLGQLDPVIGYRASCEHGQPNWSPQTGPHPRPYDWSGLKCSVTDSYEVKITRP